MLLVKWIFMLVGLFSLPIQSAQQYTEAECILIKQQMSDYKRRLGVNSGPYAQSKKSFDSHCKIPTRPTVKKSHIIAKQKASQKTQKTLSTQPHSALSINTKQSNGEASSMVVTMLKPLLPIFFMCVVGIVSIAYFKQKLPQIKGRIGEKHVIKGLEQHLGLNEYSIINDVTLPLEDGGTTQVDHIVVSRFGIFVIETKNMSGWVFGNENQAKWTQTIHRSKHQFQNPLRQNYKHTKTLSELLDLPHDVFHSMVVFTSNAELKTKMPDNVGYLKDMMSYIKAFNEEIIDYKLKLRVLKLIDVIKLKQGRKTNKQHVDYLNETKRNGVAP